MFVYVIEYHSPYIKSHIVIVYESLEKAFAHMEKVFQKNREPSYSSETYWLWYAMFNEGEYSITKTELK